jgi:hypothetical protein
MNRLYVQQGDKLLVLPVVVPNQWAGEKACLVGPFSSREIAEAFAHVFAVAFTDLGDEPVVARRDSYYVTIAA